MNNQVRKKLIFQMALEVLQNVLPTNIMENLEKFDDDNESNNFTDDLDEEHFIHQVSLARVNNDESVIDPFIEPLVIVNQFEPNASLTYFEIVEQEMLQSLPVTKDNITVCYC